MILSYRTQQSLNRSSCQTAMKLRDAVHILMLSPIYFYLPVPQRLLLVKEYCQAVNSSPTLVVRT